MYFREKVLFAPAPVQRAFDFQWQLKAPRAKAAGVLSGPSTLPSDPAAAGRLALVPVGSDCWADGLRLWGRQSFGATTAPHSPVGAPVRARPAASPPKLRRRMTAR